MVPVPPLSGPQREEAIDQYWLCPNAALLLQSQRAHSRAVVQVYCLPPCLDLKIACASWQVWVVGVVRNL